MRRIARLRPTPALVVASIALLVALCGTSAAAVALLPRNSVGSTQVIDGSLKSRDFEPGVLPNSIKRFSHSLAGPIAFQTGDNDVSIAALSVPEPGTYLILAKGHFTVNDTGINCELISGGSTDTSGASLPLLQAGEGANATLTHVVVQELASPGNVELRCSTTAKSRRIIARDVSLVALKFAS